MDGLQLKSVNRWYNKQISTLKDGKPQGFWSKRLAFITEKRHRQMRDAVNKAARIVINHCIENRIGRIVFGWNQGQKNEANLGSKTNQKFVQIPTARLKNRISQLCERYGIEFVETEESYTSQASFVDGDVLPTIGEKPEGWQASGKRLSRHLSEQCSLCYILGASPAPLQWVNSFTVAAYGIRPLFDNFFLSLQVRESRKAEQRGFSPLRSIIWESPLFQGGEQSI